MGKYDFLDDVEIDDDGKFKSSKKPNKINLNEVNSNSSDTDRLIKVNSKEELIDALKEINDRSHGKNNKNTNKNNKIINKNNNPYLKSNGYLKDDASLDDYLNDLREKTKYDPCPKIKADHYIWKKLLQVAEKHDKDTYNRLHYLRGQQCRLKIGRDKNDSSPVLKLAIEESEWLLEQYMTDEELGIDTSNHEQMKLIQSPEDQFREVGKERIRNINREKKKKKLAETAKQRVLEEVVLPKLVDVKTVFDKMKPFLKKAEDRSGVLNFNLNSLNTYLRNKERGYK